MEETLVALEEALFVRTSGQLHRRELKEVERGGEPRASQVRFRDHRWGAELNELKESGLKGRRDCRGREMEGRSEMTKVERCLRLLV